MADDFTRSQRFTPPRTITLDTAYDGAVTINVWTGYAVMVVSKTGARRVVVGPKSVFLQYDETLEAFELSTGTPKVDDHCLRTAYLRVLNNKVSDLIQGETRDLCRVSLLLSYRVNFEGPPEQWFNVENYVKFLTDHLRSMIRNAIKRKGVQEFYSKPIDLIRDTVLGVAGEDHKRPGRLFTENGMRIYDVEILDVSIGDQSIAQLMLNAQHSVVNQALELAAQERRLEFVTRNEELRRGILERQAETTRLEHTLEIENLQRKLRSALTELEGKQSAQDKALSGQLSEQDTRSQIHQAELGRKQAVLDQELAVAKQRLEQRIAEIRAEVDALVQKAEAVSPDLIAALQAFSDRALTERVAESMAPLAILGGKSVAEVIGQLLQGTALENVAKLIPAAATAPAPKEKYFLGAIPQTPYFCRLLCFTLGACTH